MKKLFISVIAVTYSAVVYAQNLKDYTILRTSTPMVIDAQIGDWAGVSPTEYFHIYNGSSATANSVNCRMQWDDYNLFLYFHVDDNSIKTSVENQDAYLWQKGDVVEMIFDFDGNGNHYLEMGINPNGNEYDFNIICSNANCGGWSDNQIWDIENIEIATRIDRSQDLLTDYGFDIEVKIPFASFNSLTGSNFQTPTNGTQWRGNLMMVNYDKNASTVKEYLAWSSYPIGQPAFHQPNYFGYFNFSSNNVSTVDLIPSNLSITNLGNYQFAIDGNQNYSVAIFDASGRKLRTENNVSLLDLSTLESGLFIIEAANEKEKTTYKLIK